jgi:hypothetical protein
MSAVQLLPPLTAISFPERSVRESYPYRALDQPPRGRPASSTASLSNTATYRPRQSSPASLLSVASAPLPRNDENVAPSYIDGTLRQPSVPLRITSPSDFRPFLSTTSLPKSHGSLKEPSRPVSTLSPPSRTREPLLLHDDVPEKDDILQAALDDLEKYRTSRARVEVAPSTLSAPDQNHVIEKTHTKEDEPTPLPALPHITSRVTEVAEIPSTVFPLQHKIGDGSSDFGSGPSTSPVLPRSRHSNSSGFVHTIKTASLSNLSFSMLSKRLRPSQSSESRAFFGTHSRFSTDSDRPATTSSIDDSALWRSVKRRRIIEELVMTEESYVSDLKALVYLISTLLASATSLPHRVRNLVQRNILDILHLHEGLVDSLHNAAFKAAARKWADTLAPKKMGGPRHVRWRSLDSQVNSIATPNRRFVDVSKETTAVSRRKARMVGVDPGDLTEILGVFRKTMVHFFIYEEYCANHEIIAHDLQRHLPSLWSTYSSGIESLARSLTAIGQRSGDGRKALTVSDLLIKPIQRVCKYPLLFDELLSYTPVSDDPTVHAELETLLQGLRDVVESVNHATQNPETRLQIHRRWSLRAHLTFDRVPLSQDDFRLLGNVSLCGVLHVAYQTRHGVTGAYALCVLYQQSLLIALPTAAAAKFDVVALIHLHDLKVDSASDGKGLSSFLLGVSVLSSLRFAIPISISHLEAVVCHRR